MLGSSGESGDFIPERFGESELWSFDENKTSSGRFLYG